MPLFSNGYIQELTKGSLSVKDIYTTVLSTAYDGHLRDGVIKLNFFVGDELGKYNLAHYKCDVLVGC